MEDNKLDDKQGIQRQLNKYTNILNKPQTKVALIISLIFVILFQVFDSFGYGIYGNMQEIIIKDFAGLSFDANITAGSSGYTEYQKALSTFTLVNTMGYVTLGIMPLYRSLADKLGRKPILIISTLFLGIAMFISGLTHNMFIFAMASVMIIFFSLHDVAMLYLFEIVPDNKRATWVGIVRAVGAVAMTALTCIRFMAIGTDGTAKPVPWRASYIVLGFLFIFLAFLAILFLKESKQYMIKKSQLLETKLREKNGTSLLSLENQKDEKIDNLKMSTALKLLFENSQLKWISIAIILLFAANNMILSYSTSILAQNGLSTLEITFALIVNNIVSTLVFLLMGMVSDKHGRKKSILFFGILTSVGFLMFTFVSPIITAGAIASIFAGVGLGITTASYGNMQEIILIMLNESTPTHMRGVVNGVRNFFMVSSVFSALFGAYLFRIMPVGKACFVLTVPFILMCVYIVITKVKETANISLEDIDKQF